METVLEKGEVLSLLSRRGSKPTVWDGDDLHVFTSYKFFDPVLSPPCGMVTAKHEATDETGLLNCSKPTVWDGDT